MTIQVDQEGFNLVMQLCNALHQEAAIRVDTLTLPLRAAMKAIPPQNNLDTTPKEG